MSETHDESGVAVEATVAPAPRPSHAALRQLLGTVGERPHDLDAIVEAADEAVIAFDANRRILHANRAAEELFGHGRGELDGMQTDILVPERLRQPQAPPVAPTTDVLQVDLPGLRRDGVELEIEWTFASVSTSSGAIFVMTVRDHALAEQAIDALRASEERFRLLVDGVPEYAIYMLDPSGHVSSWNKGAERIKGYTADEIIGQPYEIFFTPEDRAAGVPARLLAAAVREGGQDNTAVRVRKDGTSFRASAYLTALRSPTGELRGFAKVTRDLTEKLQAEELERHLSVERARREAAEAAAKLVSASEERVRRLQGVTAALSEAATPRRVAAVALEQCQQALGAAAVAIYGMSADGRSLRFLDQRGHPTEMMSEYASIPLDVSAPLTDAARDRVAVFYESFEDCAARYPALREAIGSGGFEASAALPLVTGDAVFGVLGLRFTHVRRFDEGDRTLLLTLSELCAQALERARLFAAESEARAQAEAASRAKDEFLAMLGHELRNPLAPIVTALTLMRLNQGSDAAEKTRTIIERQVAHLVHLVDDLLDVSRITQGKIDLKRERVELAAVVTRAIELSSPLLEQHHHHLAVSVPSEGLALDGDAMRLAQVVSNLLTNSAKYTPPGGHIEITALRRDERIVLTVRDDGIGIAPGTLPHVFGLFTQERQPIDRSHGGLGLGLAIVKSLVTMHDGVVSASSEGPGRGSTFTVELPAATLVAPRRTADGPPPSQRSSRPARRVLVVDDNPDAAELLAEVLAATGDVAMVANDGPEALRVAESFRPEVALLDIGLPVMDGYELARRLREQLGSVRLIAVTGYGQEADRKRVVEAGFDGHMIKPVDLEALRSALA